MKYGCIGEHLKHSFSKEIHNALADYEYEIVEIAKDKLDDFAVKRDFTAINVTIPYKEKIIPHLYYIDEHAKLIGAVNTVVNRDGKLYGYNTDFYGMSKLLEHAKISVKGKKVAILGTGGTSKTAKAVATSLGAKTLLTVSRTPNQEYIGYQTLINEHGDTEIIINTTPLGMYPNNYSCPVDIDCFKNLQGVIDAVYNPLRTVLVSKALERGIPAECGLYMLVAQAVKACEIFTDKTLDPSALENTYQKILSQKENIVLVGMPTSGKTTVGSILASLLQRLFIDTDLKIEKGGEKISDIFIAKGEKYFRDLESDCILQTSKTTCSVIATGGGAILRPENVKALKQNGRIYFIDRPLEKLIPTSDRPLSKDVESITKRYNERYHIYNSVCDVKVDADCSANEVANKITGDFLR